MRTTTLAVLATVALAAFAVASEPTQGATTLGDAERAQIMMARGSWAAAADAYRAAIEASPKDASLHNRLGICYQRSGDVKSARRAYKMAIFLNRSYAEALNNLGTLEHTEGRYKQAIRSYGEAIRIKPENASFHKNLGSAWLARGNVDKALAAWTEAIQRDPAAFENEGVAVASADFSLARQYYLYAKLAAKRGQVEQALGYLVKAHAAGFKDFATLERDRDFSGLVRDPRYAALK